MVYICGFILFSDPPHLSLSEAKKGRKKRKKNEERKKKKKMKEKKKEQEEEEEKEEEEEEKSLIRYIKYWFKDYDLPVFQKYGSPSHKTRLKVAPNMADPISLLKTQTDLCLKVTGGLIFYPCSFF